MNTKKNAVHIFDCHLVLENERMLGGTYKNGTVIRKIDAKANLFTGEISHKEIAWHPNIRKVEIEFNEIVYNLTVEAIGGRYFVKDYKHQPLFQNYTLHKKLQKDLKCSNVENNSTKRKKL